MYETFYGMKTEAFCSLPSPTTFFKSRTHREGWHYLSSGIKSQEPVLLVTGDYGTGKTLLCLTLVDAIKRKNLFPFTYISAANCTYAQILSKIIAALGLESQEKDDFSLERSVHRYLENKEDVQALYVIVDDIHEFHSSTLNKLRLLANFNHQNVFPIRLICFAHSCFLDRLKGPSLRALHERIRKKFVLAPFDFLDTKEYIYFRLINSGAPGSPYFSDETIQQISSYTGGIPRLINNLCDACLLIGAMRELDVIDSSVLTEAARHLGWDNKAENMEAPSASLESEEEQDAEDANRGIKRPKQTQEEIDFTNMGATAPREPKAAFLSLKKKILRGASWQGVNFFRERKSSKIVLAVILLIAVIAAWFFMVRGMVVTPVGSRLGQKNAEIIDTPEPGSYAEEKSRLDGDNKDSDTKREVVEVEKRIAEEGNFEVSAGASVTEDSRVHEKKEISASPVSETSVETLPESKTTPTRISKDFQTGLASRPYSLILASCRYRKNAQKALDDFRSQGLYPLSLGKVKSRKGGILWVVYTGCYESKEEGEIERRKQNRPDAIVRKMPYSNLVGTFRSKTEMPEAQQHLERVKN